jgi:hypothetical protein
LAEPLARRTNSRISDEADSGRKGVNTAAVATSSKVRFNDNIVRVGVNYHFGSPAVSQY